MAETVVVARIVKTRGIRGEVVAELLTDFPERFEELNEVQVRLGSRVFPEKIESFWFHRDRVVLKFVGRERPHEVDELVGGTVEVPAEDRFPITEKDSYYRSDLIGCQVMEEGKVLGSVVDVVNSAAGESLLVQRIGGRFLLPLVKAFVKEVSLARREILVELPPGLADLPAD